MAGTTLSISDSGIASELLIALVKTGTAEKVLIQLGKSDKEVEALIANVSNAIKETERRDALKGFKDSLTVDVVDFGNDWLAATELPAGVTNILCHLQMSSVETKIAGDQVMKPGAFVSQLSVKFAGEEKWTSLSKIGKAKGNGKGGGRARVPMPDDAKAAFKSWSGYYIANYPEDAAKREGSSYSAPARLAKLGDEIYLAARAATLEAPEPSKE